ncbi:MAG: hypothetical protein AB1449_08090 [Chloroflexota bacterium]
MSIYPILKVIHLLTAVLMAWPFYALVTGVWMVLARGQGLRPLLASPILAAKFLLLC